MSCFFSRKVSGSNKNPHDCYTKVDSTCPKGSIYNDIDLSSRMSALKLPSLFFLFTLQLVEAELATSLTIIGAWFGSILGSYPAELYGRKPTLLGNNIFFISGAAISASGNMYALFVGRFISGRLYWSENSIVCMPLL